MQRVCGGGIGRGGYGAAEGAARTPREVPHRLYGTLGDLEHTVRLQMYAVGCEPPRLDRLDDLRHLERGLRDGDRRLDLQQAHTSIAGVHIPIEVGMQ